MEFLQLFSNVFYIFLAILVLLFMVTIHELGHYVAGKILKFKILEFSIGFGPVLYKRKSKKTGELFLIKLIPLGGYCAFDGEDEEKNNPEAFNNQKPWKRIIVLVSGVFMNFLFSVLLAVIIFATVGMYFPSVSEVLPDSDTVISEEYKLKEGDIILAVDGNYLYLNGDLKTELNKFEDNDIINVTVIRDNTRQNISIKKRNYLSTDNDGNDITATGLGILQGFDSYRLGFFESISKGIVYCFKMAGVILIFFGKLITGQLSFSQIGGPISTIGITVEVAKQGFRPLLEITTLIGVNLAVFNILPIPALDGSRVVFTAIEWIRKKPIKREIEGKIHFVGLLVLFGFVILADVFHILGNIF